VRIVRFRKNGAAGYGVVDGKEVHHLECDVSKATVAGDRVGQLNGLDLLAPTEPTKIIPRYLQEQDR
jgi:hypothetical protein